MQFFTARFCMFSAAAGAAALVAALNAPAQARDAPEAVAGVPAGLPAPAPRYAASQLQQAFDFMDANRDGRVSREEASGFRGVARHFDQADANQDGFLSRDEFDTAMNHVKPK